MNAEEIGKRLANVQPGQVVKYEIDLGPSMKSSSYSVFVATIIANAKRSLLCEYDGYTLTITVLN